MNKTYFAMLPREQIAAELYKKIGDYYEHITRNGRLDLWRKVYRAAFSLDDSNRHEASQINTAGTQGELSTLKANHYRNLITHLHVLVTQQKTAYECRATNTDVKSQLQTILGSQVLEYYLREQHLEDHFRQLAEYALYYGEGYMCVGWDTNAGDPVSVDPESQKPVMTGDIKVQTYGPELIRDIAADSDMRKNWYIVPDRVSRYELAAEYPEFADRIMEYSEDALYLEHTYNSSMKAHEEDEFVTVWSFYHDKTKACRLGRVAKFIGADICLEYGVLPYEKLQVHRMAAYNQHGTSFGYTVAFDLLCVQEAIDRLYSIILSNQSAFGVQNIWMKTASNVSPLQVAGGLNVIVSPEKPEPINLTHTPAEIFNFLKSLESLGETISGVNSVARGQPEASLKSGAALAMVASQAVQFSNGITAAYTKVREEVGTSIISTLQSKAAIPRVAMITGKANRSYAKTYSGKDLMAINRAIVDVGNPVSQTIAGRLGMADSLIQNGAVNAEQYIQIALTGRLEVGIDDEKQLQILINAENESLREGKQVPVVATDRHVMHIKSHMGNLSDPEVRHDQVLTAATLEHIQMHIDALRNTDPMLLNLMGEPTNFQAPPGAAPVGEGQNAPQPPANQSAPEGGQNQVPAPANSSPEIAANMPSLPPNAPATTPTQPQ